MPIRPARSNPDDKEATANVVAALILVAWAELRQYRDVDKGTLTSLWQEIKDKLPP
jgi:hypothetical protein